MSSGSPSTPSSTTKRPALSAVEGPALSGQPDSSESKARRRAPRSWPAGADDRVRRSPGTRACTGRGRYGRRALVPPGPSSRSLIRPSGRAGSGGQNFPLSEPSLVLFESRDETARDQLLEELVGVPPVRDTGKRPVLPACRAEACSAKASGRHTPECSSTSSRKCACRGVKPAVRKVSTRLPNRPF